jgi:hypothetical protein
MDMLNRYGSDKVANGYGPVYAALFRNRLAVRSLLEVGIGTMIPDVPSSMARAPRRGADYQPGASLRSWRDWFTHAHIVGLDPQPDCQLDEPGIMTIQADSTDAELMYALGDTLARQFDVIIDDGLHTEEAQLATLCNLWSWLAPGGLYVIEDVRVKDPLLWPMKVLAAGHTLSTLAFSDPNAVWHYPITRHDTTSGHPAHYGLIVITKPRV